MTKEEIVTDIRQFISNVTFINDCTSLLKTMELAKEKYKKEMNLAPTFFGVTQQALVKIIIIETYKIFEVDIDKEDKENVIYSKHTKNIGRFINMMEMHTKLLQNPLYNGVPIGDEPKELIKTSINEFNELKHILKKLKHQRDKIYAHSDGKYFLYKNQMDLGENNITYGEIEKLTAFASMTLNNFIHYLNEIPQLSMSTNTDDLLVLLKKTCND